MGNYREVGTEIEYQLVKLDKIEVGLVKLDVFRNYWTVQFREISSQVKSPNFGYRAYRTHCVIGPVGVQFGWFHSSRNYFKAFGVFQCCWFSYRFHIKQVIISCEFCQHFKYLEVLLSFWMSLWYLNILGTWIEILNRFENLLF